MPRPIAYFFVEYTDYSKLIREQSMKECSDPKFYGVTKGTKGKYSKNFAKGYLQTTNFMLQYCCKNKKR